MKKPNFERKPERVKLHFPWRRIELANVALSQSASLFDKNALLYALWREMSGNKERQ